MKLSLDCRTLSRLISQAQDKAPPLVYQARMQLHLIACQACRDIDDQMRFVRSAMQELKMDLPNSLAAAEPPKLVLDRKLPPN